MESDPNVAAGYFILITFAVLAISWIIFAIYHIYHMIASDIRQHRRMKARRRWWKLQERARDPNLTFEDFLDMKEFGQKCQ